MGTENRTHSEILTCCLYRVENGDGYSLIKVNYQVFGPNMSTKLAFEVVAHQIFLSKTHKKVTGALQALVR